MYTLNGKYINFENRCQKCNNKKNIEHMSNSNKLIEHMDNSTASFNTLSFHDKDKPSVKFNYIGDKITINREEKGDKGAPKINSMISMDFANDTTSIYSNLTLKDNLIFFPDTEEQKLETNKGMIFYNKDKKIVGAIHKDSKDKSDLVFRSGYSDESAFGLTERLRIVNSENRVEVSGALGAKQLCLGSTCFNEGELIKLNQRNYKVYAWVCNDPVVRHDMEHRYGVDAIIYDVHSSEHVFQ